MIKRLFMALVIAVAACSAQAQKTEYLALGVETGLNFNTMSFARSDFESSNRMGFFLGPKLRVKVPLLGFGLDAAFLYSLNSTKVVTETPKGEEIAKRSLSYFEIPLNLRYTFDFRVLALYVASGPQYNYCLSTDASLAKLYGPELANYSRSTWGWNIGAGIELAHRFQVAVTYTIPISETGRLSTGDMDNIVTNFKQRTAKIRLAYYF